MKRKSLAVGIVFLFIFSTITPVVISNDKPVKQDEYPNYITYNFLDNFSSAKLERYEELLQKEQQENEDYLRKSIMK